MRSLGQFTKVGVRSFGSGRSTRRCGCKSCLRDCRRRWHIGTRCRRTSRFNFALQPLQVGADVSRVLVCNSRSFSSDLLMIRSSSVGISGFSRTGGVGARSRIAWKISADVSPRKGNVPVVISYSTAPNENGSVRASSSFAFALLRRHVGYHAECRARAC